MSEVSNKRSCMQAVKKGRACFKLMAFVCLLLTNAGNSENLTLGVSTGLPNLVKLNTEFSYNKFIVGAEVSNSFFFGRYEAYVGYAFENDDYSKQAIKRKLFLNHCPMSVGSGRVILICSLEMKGYYCNQRSRQVIFLPKFKANQAQQQDVLMLILSLNSLSHIIENLQHAQSS